MSYCHRLYNSAVPLELHLVLANLWPLLLATPVLTWVCDSLDVGGVADAVASAPRSAWRRSLRAFLVLLWDLSLSLTGGWGLTGPSSPSRPSSLWKPDDIMPVTVTSLVRSCVSACFIRFLASAVECCWCFQDLMTPCQSALSTLEITVLVCVIVLAQT